MLYKNRGKVSQTEKSVHEHRKWRKQIDRATLGTKLDADQQIKTANDGELPPFSQLGEGTSF